ncbi:GspE/PulE family protein [Campylobacter sp. MIT 99-7217]|uniref:GspE/PulE family protein n=1 Tax=Campylobacter sp. MIT 99-7217 TaxID=535091 RepID=UPI00163B772D|nr:GspE/PulE family protein [Campylobacter sp. MIT 99-7217]
MNDDFLQYLCEVKGVQKASIEEFLREYSFDDLAGYVFLFYEKNPHFLNRLCLHFKLKVEDFLRSFASFKGLEFVDLSLDEVFVSKLPLNLLLSLKALPFKEDKENIYIAFCEPSSFLNLQKIQNFFKDKFVKPYLANPLKIAEFLQDLSLKEQISLLLAQIKTELKDNTQKEQSGVSAFFELLIKEAIRLRTSDIHLEPSENRALIRFRIDGVLSLFLELEYEIYEALNSYIKLKSHLNLAEKRKAQDGSFSMSFEGLEYDFRLSSLPLFYGESLVIRILEHKKDFFALEHLNFLNKDLNLLKKKIHEAYGLILLTGPTGSGKSTTLYACLNEIKSMQKKIITAEDPIEYKLDLVQQILLNEKAGLDFNNALRAILRQDPDVIMIGEIRDEQSLDIAIKSSLTGHLVFSTLHTNDALGAVSRMLDMNAKPYLLASSLSLVIAQRLVRKLCVHCSFKSSKRYKEFEGEFYEALGCEYCKMSGYKGRELVAEFLFVDEQVSELIRSNATKQEFLSYLKKQGYKSMLENGLQKAEQGITSIEELLRVLR